MPAATLGPPWCYGAVKAATTLGRRGTAGLALVGALALLVGLFASDTAGAAPKLRCPGAGGKTVLRTKAVRVFTLPGRFSTNRDYYGCVHRKGRAFRISLIEYEGVIIDKRSIRVTGRYVALVQTIPLQDTSADLVVVRSLVTGRATHVRPRRVLGRVRDLVVKPTGSVAFIHDPSNAVRQLRVTTTNGETVVDQGPDIDPTSLELSPDGRSVTYLKAGERRSAPIP